MGSHFPVEDLKTVLLNGTTPKLALSKPQQRPLTCLLPPASLHLFLPPSLLKIYREIKRLGTDKAIERNKVAGFIS